MKPALTHERFSKALDTASNVFDIPRACIVGRRRMAPIARARLAVYAALYLAFDASSTDIAARFQRDHTTVLEGIKSAQRRARANPEYRAAIRKIARGAK